MSYRLIKHAFGRLNLSSCDGLWKNEKQLYASFYPIYSNRNYYSKYNYSKLPPDTLLKLKCSHIPNYSLMTHNVSFSTSNSLNNKEKVGILQRFKNAYKEYGKLLVVVHLVTSAVWISSFYYVAYSGLDLLPLMQKIGAGESALKVIEKSGNFAVAYLLYKIATPFRYAVTIGGTQVTAHYLFKYEYMKPIPQQDSLGALFKESSEQALEDFSGNIKRARTATRLAYIKSVKSAKNNKHLGHIKKKFNHMGKVKKR